MIRRAERCGAAALVVTLDTTILGWRPQDLNLGSLPFVRGQGLAQYTSDPRFREIVRDRVASATGRPRARVSLGALRTLISMSREHPGSVTANLLSPEPRAAVEAFLDVYSNPGLSWNHIATLRHRTSLPIVLKGILRPDDARKAVELISGDTVPATMAAIAWDGTPATRPRSPSPSQATPTRYG